MNDFAVAMPPVRRFPMGHAGMQRKDETTFSVGPGGRASFYWQEHLFKDAGFDDGIKVKGRAEGDKVYVSLGNQSAPKKTMGQVLIARLPVGAGGKPSTRLQVKFHGLLPNIQEFGATEVSDAYVTPEGELCFVLPAHRAAAKKLKANDDDMRALENALSLVNRAISKGIAKANLDDGRVVLSVTTVRLIGKD